MLRLSDPALRRPRLTRTALALAALGTLLELAAQPVAAAETAAALDATAAPTAGSAAAPAPAQASDSVLPAVQVVGRRQSGQYHGRQSEGATKTDTPVIEVPQAVRVVTRQLVDDLGALRLDDVLDYVAGVSRQNNFGGTWDNIAMRGFAGHEDTGMSLLRNGMPSNRGFNAPRDTANVERIEFLKGTMGALYGSSEPGGTVNIVTKQPRFTAGHSVETYYGSHDYKRVALDTTGPINGSASRPATLAYRLNLSAEDKDSFRDHVHSRRELVAPALTWKIAPTTVVRYDGEWLRQSAPLDRGVVAPNGQVGAVPISRFYGEPADGDITIDNQTHQLFLEQALAPDWQLRAGLQYKRGTLEGLASEPHQYGPGFTNCSTSWETTGLLCRRLRERDFASHETSMQVDVLGKLDTAGLKHDLLLGMEAARYTIDQRMRQQSPAAFSTYGIDVYNPVYGAARPELSVTAMDRTLKDRTSAVYAQDQISLTPEWKLLAGVRHDRYDGRIDDRNMGVTEQDPSATSPRLGLTWLPKSNLSFYASLGRSFRPQTNTNAAGETLAPEVGKSHELGTKWQSEDGRLGGGIALFDISKRNTTKYDENGTYLVPVPGEVRNKGLEAELSGWVARGWRVALSYAYLDTDPTITQFARHNGSAFVVHEMSVGDGLLGIGGGVTYVGPRTGDTQEPSLPSYTVAKLTGYWNATRNWRVSLDVDNVFNRTYYTSAYNSVWVTPGNPRQFTLGAQYKF